MNDGRGGWQFRPIRKLVLPDIIRLCHLQIATYRYLSARVRTVFTFVHLCTRLFATDFEIMYFESQTSYDIYGRN